MSNQSEQIRAASDLGIIKIPFDPARSPREQIEAAIASAKSGICERHPQEILPVDKRATFWNALRRAYPDQDQFYEVRFSATCERCSKCPHNEASHDNEITNCAVGLVRIFTRDLCIRDEKGKPLPTHFGSARFEVDQSANAQFDAWLATLGKVRCELSKEALGRRGTRMTAPFKEWTIKPQFALCLRCRLEHLGINPDDSHASFEGFVVEPPALQPHLEQCRAFAAAPKGVLLLLGNCGTGKTHLAIAILRERLRRGEYSPVFVKHRHFLAEHWRSLRPVPFEEEPPESPLSRCQQTPLLVYDELTATTDSRAYEDVLLDLFERRIGHFKPSIITANVSRTDLEAVLGSRLHDRLRRAAFAVLEFGFDSKRKSLNDDYLKRSRSSGSA